MSGNTSLGYGIVLPDKKGESHNAKYHILKTPQKPRLPAAKVSYTSYPLGQWGYLLTERRLFRQGQFCSVAWNI
jgi:hypothetical protein